MLPCLLTAFPPEPVVCIGTFSCNRPTRLPSIAPGGRRSFVHRTARRLAASESCSRNRPLMCKRTTHDWTLQSGALIRRVASLSTGWAEFLQFSAGPRLIFFGKREYRTLLRSTVTTVHSLICQGVPASVDVAYRASVSVAAKQSCNCSFVRDAMMPGRPAGLVLVHVHDGPRSSRSTASHPALVRNRLVLPPTYRLVLPPEAQALPELWETDSDRGASSQSAETVMFTGSSHPTQLRMLSRRLMQRRWLLACLSLRR